jgi:Tfp pilus assembly protein PilN
MPTINLIESRLIATAKLQQTNRMSKMIFLGTCSVMGMAYFALFGQGLSLSNEERQLATRVNKMRPLIFQTEELKKEESGLKPKLQTLEDAQTLTNRWARLMVHLSRNTPPDVWLSSVRAAAMDAEKPIHVTFNGVSRTQTDASEMLLRMQNAEDLESVNLGGTQEKLLEKTTAYEFELNGDIVGTAEKKKKAEGVK